MSADWAAGYVADIGYTYGYYGELNPLRSRLALLSANIVPTPIETACELGFGQGVSANIHAAGAQVAWYGNDFNPSQAALAQEMAAMSGAAATWSDDAFVDFAQRSDLPDFDFIGMHGIWSWISDANRLAIVDFIRRKLKVGGVLFVSYNTMPGWAAFAPIRHLMTSHGEILGSQGRGTAGRVDAALDFADRLLQTNPLFSVANPQVAERLQALKGQNRLYLAHEYFNRDWHPMHFSDMAGWLAPAKLSYACSAFYPDHIDKINLKAEQQAFLAEIPDPILRESARDFMTNQQFRRDYWIKGPRPLSPLSRSERLRAHRVQLAMPRSHVSLSIKGALGDANLSAAVHDPILDLLADQKPRTLGQIEQELAGRTGITLSQILDAALLLGSTGTVAAIHHDAVIDQARAKTDRFNRWVIDRARSGDDINYLASPVTGGGVYLPRLQQLFLLARANGRKTPREWAQATWEILSAQGQKLVKGGATLEDADANLAEIAVQAEEFAAPWIDSLSSLGIG